MARIKPGTSQEKLGLPRRSCFTLVDIRVSSQQILGMVWNHPRSLVDYPAHDNDGAGWTRFSMKHSSPAGSDLNREHRPAASARTTVLLVAMRLAEARGGRCIAPNKVADLLRKTQEGEPLDIPGDRVSIAALRDVIGMFGGRLKITAEFPDQEVSIDL